jgi:hypothetical protein
MAMLRILHHAPFQQVQQLLLLQTLLDHIEFFIAVDTT